MKMPSGLYHQLARRSEQRTNRTYHLTSSTIARLSERAAALGVGVSDLADFLLKEGLDQIDAGELDVPTRAAVLRVIDRR